MTPYDPNFCKIMTFIVSSVERSICGAGRQTDILQQKYGPRFHFEIQYIREEASPKIPFTASGHVATCRSRLN